MNSRANSPKYAMALFVGIVACVMVRTNLSAQDDSSLGDTEKERKVVLTTSDDLDSIRHKISGGNYGIEISHTMTLLGVDKIDFSVTSGEKGEWSQSDVVSGANVLVKRTGRNEPRGCIVRVAEPITEDPATEFAEKTGKRLENEIGKITGAAARGEIDRLVNQFGLSTKHVLKLPRSAANRSEPQKTLMRLCRWVSYDKLFLRIGLDPRPVATESDAEALYEQVLEILRGGELPRDPEQRLISEEELKILKEAYSFTFTATFVPELFDSASDLNWRQAAKVAIGQEEMGQVTWHGKLGVGHQASTWLAIPSEIDRDGLKISSDTDSKFLKWMFVEGDGSWQYIRLLNISGKEVPSFRISIDGSRVAGPEASRRVEVIQREPRSLEFPF